MFREGAIFSTSKVKSPAVERAFAWQIGVAEILGGTERIGEIAQRSGGTLKGVTWIVRDGAMLEMAGDGFTTKQADVTLNSDRARVDRIFTVTDNQGALRLLSGREFTAVDAFSNSGTLQLAGGEFGAPSLANLGTLTGFGTAAVRPTNTDNVVATGGTLAFANGVDASAGAGELPVVKHGKGL